MHRRPQPTYSFIIPSIHDDTPLDCRIYHPHHIKEILHELRGTASEYCHKDDTLEALVVRAPNRLRAAVLAHPYAPLGGTYDDAVVLSVASVLLQEGSVSYTHLTLPTKRIV